MGFILMPSARGLSQGIDVPSLEKVIRSSYAKVRLETIQRIGRRLRTVYRKPAKIATVVDFALAGEDSTQNPTGVDYECFLWFERLARVRPLSS